MTLLFICQINCSGLVCYLVEKHCGIRKNSINWSYRLLKKQTGLRHFTGLRGVSPHPLRKMLSIPGFSRAKESKSYSCDMCLSHMWCNNLSIQTSTSLHMEYATTEEQEQYSLLSYTDCNLSLSLFLPLTHTHRVSRTLTNGQDGYILNNYVPHLIFIWITLYLISPYKH